MRAYFAAGCFWGVEHLFEKLPGVQKVTSGYMGGHVDSPSYREVTTGTTGHLEAVEVEYDEKRIPYYQLVKFFFEIHDPTQVERQGPDVGVQYSSRVWWNNEAERTVIEHFIVQLEEDGVTKVATTFEEHRVSEHQFWPAETYHQDYYAGNGHQPYCHAWQDKGLDTFAFEDDLTAANVDEEGRPVNEDPTLEKTMVQKKKKEL
eukprot:CAMPEP_0178999872 /NCGR_PEP_ID=MMETSP0795-20121207/10341_1 /TAXON_ID=88552 /ORGANISM="Amoebophrya sp., Strain Ameob2" /LENGTH=203 /DNA_ID=CAMNT_0020692773 /DNA_START=97 /DNA_END=708 /DNA_ORIENTATION=+